MDPLLKALDARGFPVEVKPRSRERRQYTRTTPIPNRTGADINGEFVAFGIFEERKQIKTPTGDWRGHEIRYQDTGRLTLHVVGAVVDGLRSRWGDGKIQRVEGVLASFIIGLERTAVGMQERRLKHERWERERLERLRIEEERREAQALEKRRLDDLDVRVRDFSAGG